MRRFSQSSFIVAACFSVVLGATPALAKTHHHRSHAHHAHHHAKKSVKSSIISTRAAQEYLTNLDYYQGAVNGKMNAETRKALKNFQRDHGLKADGKLGSKTSRALVAAGCNFIGKHSMRLHEAMAENVPAREIGNGDYASAIKGNTENLNSRYASVDINQTGSGANKAYNVTVNGNPILSADGQASVIGVSPTYDLGNEDVIIFTTYSPAEPNCLYHTRVLMLMNNATNLGDVDNCTRNYTARVDGGSLYITFPEYDDARAIGATYRVEGMSVEHL